MPRALEGRRTLLMIVLAVTLILAGPTPQADAAGGDHSVSGTGCWSDARLLGWEGISLYLEVSCLEIEAYSAGGGSGVATFTDTYGTRLATLTLDCVAVEESAAGHTLFASGTDVSAARAWITVTGKGYSVGRSPEAYSPCGAAEAVRHVNAGGFTFSHSNPGANSLPSPAFTWTCTGFTCTFDSSGTTDSDGEVVGYRWYVTRKWHENATTSHGGRTFTLSLSRADLLEVKLIVTDDDGGSASITHEVNVGLPVSHLAPPVCRGLTCTFDASPSTDPDGQVVNYHWNLFDDGISASTDAPKFTHTYSKPGTYYAGVRVQDNQGNVSPWMDWVVVEVSDSPFVLTGKVVRQGQRHRVDLSWSGANTATVDIYRNNTFVTTISGKTYSEPVTSGTGTVTYKVCDSGLSRCSNAWSTSL